MEDKIKFNKEDILINKCAMEIMKAIVQGIYTNPQSLIALGDAAGEHKQSINQEITERSWTLANMMYKSRKKYLGGENV